MAFVLATKIAALGFADPYKAEPKIASSTSLSRTCNVGAQYFAKLIDGLSERA